MEFTIRGMSVTNYDILYIDIKSTSVIGYLTFVGSHHYDFVVSTVHDIKSVAAWIYIYTVLHRNDDEVLASVSIE
jgi:hypothetical protein